MRSKLIITMTLTPFLLNAALVEKQKKENISCESPFHVMHVDVRHTESKGVGYKEGYTTLEGFGIYDRNPYFMPFLDLRGHVFNNGKLAGNVGIGERTVIPSINHIFGLYLYYDVRQEEHDLTVNQLSPGIELLGKRMEYRLNAYFPVGRDESRGYQHKFHKFDDHQILLQKKKKIAMTGADGEVGTHITQSTRHDFYVGLGPYYFTSDASSAWGGKGRLYWRYQDYVSLETSYSYDHIFKNVVQGIATFSYPLGMKLKRKGRNCPNSNDLALSRAAFAPYRFEIPVVGTKKLKKTAINPATGAPWQVWFVDNTSHSAGTVESPFPTLAQAQNASGPNDMIYIFPGDGTTKGMDQGIILQDGQTLFGSGTNQTIRTQMGKIRIPPHSKTAPTISNPTRPVIVTLANGNEISGLVISTVGSVPSDLLLSPGVSAIDGLYLHNNVLEIFDSSFGIDIAAKGTVTITENVFIGNGGSSVGGFLDEAGQNSGLVTINISKNTFSHIDLGIILQPNILPSTTTYDITVSENTFSDFEAFAIQCVFIGNPNSIVRITNNTIRNTIGSAGDSISIFLGGMGIVDSGKYLIDNNTIINTTSSAFIKGINILPLGPTLARLSVTNNTLTVGSGVGSGGLQIVTVAGETICATITNNQVQLLGPSATTFGMNLSATAGTLNIDDFSDNIAPVIITTGNVNYLAPNSCGL